MNLSLIYNIQEDYDVMVDVVMDLIEVIGIYYSFVYLFSC